MIIFVSVLSFLMDGILSKYIASTSLFLPLFTIISLIIIYPYFNNNDYRYLKYVSIMGLLYDIAYMNTVFFNFFIFLILGFIVLFIFYFLTNNYLFNILTSVICIVIYRIIIYLFLVIVKNYSFSFNILFKSIYSSLILNIIYCTIVYLFTSLYSKKHKILKSK
ncbi:MAG: hypothetical protein RSB71_03245 [Bacilli bacterium]